MRVCVRTQVGDSVLRVESGKPAVDELSRSKVFPNSSEFEKFNKKKKKNGKGQGQGKGGDDTDCKSGANDDSNDSDDDSAREKEKEEEEKKMSVKELMDKEFAKIIGHENIKQQLKMFYKKVQLDKIRRNNGKLSEKKALYHMMFLGPPGTGTVLNAVIGPPDTPNTEAHRETACFFRVICLPP